MSNIVALQGRACNAVLKVAQTLLIAGQSLAQGGVGIYSDGVRF